MSISLYSATVPVFKQMLLALSDVLKKGEEHAQQRKFDPVVLLQSRLFSRHAATGASGPDRLRLCQKCFRRVSRA